MRDTLALILGISLLFSGAIEILHTLIVDDLLFRSLTHDKLNTIIWTYSNTLSGLILITGLLLQLKYKSHNKRYITPFILVTLLLFISVFALIYNYATTDTSWFGDLTHSRSYDESMYLITYLFLLILITPDVYKKQTNLLLKCIFYIAVLQVIGAIYILFLSTLPSAFKLMIYFIPVICLIANYTFAFNTIIESQKKLQANQEILQYIAAHDPLTGLYNRREFEILLSKMISNSERFKDQFALFVIDIDDFKLINDTLGHTQGDEFMKLFSEQLSLLTRKGETLSRIGGDEFTLITSKIQSPLSTKKLAERIMKGLNIAYPIDGKPLTITVSIGVATYPIDGETTDMLLKHADLAMYEAKKSGKNTCCFYRK